jgi:hypothetical protein
MIEKFFLRGGDLWCVLTRQNVDSKVHACVAIAIANCAND